MHRNIDHIQSPNCIPGSAPANLFYGHYECQMCSQLSYVVWGIVADLVILNRGNVGEEMLQNF